MAAVVYDRRYNLGLFGLERLHPFDVRKYGRAWRELQHRLGRRLLALHRPVDRPASDDETRLAHTPDYLASLRSPATIAEICEIPRLRYAPNWLLNWGVVTPVRWATRGTILAAQGALDEGLAINLGGGFHHAAPNRGEGFCLVNDIAVAVRVLRASGRLSPERRIAYVDLDAHQGNGVCEHFRDDRSVFVFDMYNDSAYPWPAFKTRLRERIDCDVPLTGGCRGDDYLATLRARLPGFLDSVARSGAPFGIYNAGTDVVAGDALGQFALSSADVLERDLFTIGEFRRRGIPVVMLTSGGYTRASYKLIAASVEAILTSQTVDAG